MQCKIKVFREIVITYVWQSSDIRLSDMGSCNGYRGIRLFYFRLADYTRGRDITVWDVEELEPCSCFFEGIG